MEPRESVLMLDHPDRCVPLRLVLGSHREGQNLHRGVPYPVPWMFLVAAPEQEPVDPNHMHLTMIHKNNYLHT